MIAQFKDRGLPVPSHIRPPKVIYGAEPYVEAFWSLSTDRPSVMGIGMIPFTSIDRYAHRYGYDTMDEFSVLEHVIRQMDNVYLRNKRTKSDG